MRHLYLNSENYGALCEIYFVMAISVFAGRILKKLPYSFRGKGFLDYYFFFRAFAETFYTCSLFALKGHV